MITNVSSHGDDCDVVHRISQLSIVGTSLCVCRKAQLEAIAKWSLRRRPDEMVTAIKLLSCRQRVLALPHMTVLQLSTCREVKFNYSPALST